MTTRDFIAVLDYEHLDNGMFLNAFAKSLSSHSTGTGIIIHGESEYTERLIQTGIMREEASIRAVRDLNHRLIALLADNGVSAIGLNGYQRELITKTEDNLSIDSRQFNLLPSSVSLVLSNLIQIDNADNYEPVPIPLLAQSLRQQLNIEEIFVFSSDDRDDLFSNMDQTDTTSPEFLQKLPLSFNNVDFQFRLVSTSGFSRFPDMSSSIVVNG